MVEEADEAAVLPSQSQKKAMCVCKTTTAGSVNVKCKQCKRPWHVECLGLTGLTSYMTGKLEENDWLCPLCFEYPESVKESLNEDELDVPTLQVDKISTAVRKEVEVIIPKVVSAVVDKIKETTVQDIVNEAGQNVTKVWGDMAKSDQKNMIQRVVEASSETALQKSLQTIDSNLTEQRKRVRNIVLSNVPEGSEGDNLKSVVCVAMDNEVCEPDILFARRLGKKGLRPRMIHVVLRKEDDAIFFTNNGRGRRFNDVWVNPDLTRAEREALYQKRVERRSKPSRPEQPSAETDEMTITGTVTGTGEQINNQDPPPAAIEVQPADVSNEHLNADGVGTPADM